MKLDVTGIPKSAARVLIRHYRIDQDHGNTYTVWKELGSPATPTASNTQSSKRQVVLSCLNHRSG